MTERSAFDRLGTAAKLLLVLSVIMLPIGGLLVWSALRNLEGAGATIASAAEQRAILSARTLESLIARNALALRVAANAVLKVRSGDDCADAATTLAIAPRWRAASRLRKSMAGQYARSATLPTS